jgi:hypothetical protein
MTAKIRAFSEADYEEIGRRGPAANASGAGEGVN